VLPIVTRVVSSKTPFPFLQPALAWLNIHVGVDGHLLANLKSFVEASSGDVVNVVLGDNATVPLASSWTTPEDVAEAAGAIASFLSLSADRWQQSWLSRLPTWSESASGANVPFRTSGDVTATALFEYLSRRLLRESLARALLAAVASSPKGNPAPDEVLRRCVAGCSTLVPHPHDVAPFDICDCGACVCVRVCWFLVHR
jgi:hypothetical protein